ncbi:MAG: hypothetical protein R3F39_20435 [Myxococcota bacterium]
MSNSAWLGGASYRTCTRCGFGAWLKRLAVSALVHILNPSGARVEAEREALQRALSWTLQHEAVASTAAASRSMHAAAG